MSENEKIIVNSSTGIYAFLNTEECANFSGVVIFDDPTTKEYYKFKNGKIHCEDGPANWLINRATNKKIYINYYINGVNLTKKAWNLLKNEGFNVCEEIKNEYTFNGSFYSTELGFDGFDDHLYRVRIADQWYVLRSSSRTKQWMTRKINDLIKNLKESGRPDPIELSQRQLEKLLVEQIGNVLK